LPSDSRNRTIFVVALGFWSVALTLGALRVILPVYFASVGVTVSKIALLFVLFKFSEFLADIGTGVAANRVGYRPSFIGALGIHSLISFLFVFKPTLAVIYLERFVRGLIGMPLLSSVYVKHFSRRETQRFHINMMLGLRDAAKGIGMFFGGVLIAFLPFEYSVTMFAFITTGAAVVALLYLPDLKEEARTPLLKIWGSVDGKTKALAVARGLLHGARDAWGIVILPVYLAVVFGLSPAIIGSIMMGGLVFHGVYETLISRYVGERYEQRQALLVSGLPLLVICLAMAVSTSLYLFLVFVFLYELIEATSVVYYHQLKLDFSSRAQTSIDLGTYEAISDAFKPVAVLISGILADRFGFSWAFYLSAVFVFFSLLMCLRLPKSMSRPVEVARPSVGLFSS